MTTSSNLISTAVRYHRAGQFAEAEHVYKSLLQDQPDSIDALNLLGALVYEDNRYEEAQGYFERVLTLHPAAESHNSMGIVLKAQGRHGEAVEHYRQALALKPDQPEVLSNLGNVLKEMGELEQAIAAYNQALSLRPDYAEAYNNLGIAYKEQGKLEQALESYHTAIRLKPNYAEAHHNVGIVLRIEGKLDAAIAYFRQAIALKLNYFEAYTSLGSALQEQGRLDEAVAQYETLLKLKPNHPDGYNSLALAFQQQGKPEEAISAFKQALALRPVFPGVCNNLGNLLLETDQIDEAIAFYRQAIEQRPNYPEAMNNLGNALQRQGKLEEAIEQYHRALELRPNFVEALSNLGAVLKDQHKLDDAISCLEQAITLNPLIAEIHNNLGNAYQEQRRLEDAIACYREAVALKPDMAEVHSNLGNMLQYIGEFEEAFAHFERAIELQPDFAGVYNNLGIARRNSGQVQAAFAAYDRALELKPDFVEAHWNKALNYLLLGDYDRGFEGYEWRFQWSRFIEQNPPRSYPQPRWNGSPLNGKTILIYAEQGMGDTLQFVRYLPLIVQQGGRILLECHPPLLNLLTPLTEIAQLIPLGSPTPTFDVHAPLMSLPYILHTTLETLPAQVPYLPLPQTDLRLPTPERTVDSEDPTVSDSPSALSPQPSALKIGIVWNGNPQNPYNRSRSVPLEQLLSLADISGITLYSLQKEPQPEDDALLQAHPEIHDLRSLLHDFTDTAALIEQLDLIISIDTAVTHLAGALGKPCWLLLPLAPDWRWMMDRSDSPWYPSVRLFRQSVYGEWEPVIAEVREALAERGEARGARQEAESRRQKAKGKRQREKGKGKKGKTSPHPLSASPRLPVSPSLPHSLTPHSPLPTPAKPPLPEPLKVAIRHHQAGRLQEATAACEEYLRQHPDSADGWHLLGLMAHTERHLETAIAHYQKVLVFDPDHYDTYNNLAVAFHEQGKLDEAIPYYQKVLALKPDYADAHNNYANALRERGRLDDAIVHYKQAITARPDYPDAYNNLGLAYYAQEDFTQAAEAYRQAIVRKPNYPQALNHLGNALKELGNFAEAAKYYQQAIALKPDYAKAFNNWGNIFRDEGDLQTAVQYYDQATEIDPNFAEAHWNKALTLLLGGDLQRGFVEYEWRKHVNLPSFKSLRDFPGDRWDGSPLNGRIIYLHAEQGMGDIIQFVRYVPLVVQRGGRVILECHPPLLNLLSQIPGVQQLVPYGSTPPGYHIQAPLLSLPYIFGTTETTIPTTIPYIHPPGVDCQLPILERTVNGEQWTATDSSTPHSPLPTPPLKIGLVWSGNPENPYNRTRAVPLELLASLADIPGLTLYSLQKDLQSSNLSLLQQHPEIHDLRELMPDFVNTAALIRQLDLIISVDTAVTHLAGALGKPCWLLLPYAPDWRWMLHRDDSPWYPTMRIFRQPSFGDWASVMRQVRQELGREAQGTRHEARGERDTNSEPRTPNLEPQSSSTLSTLLSTALQEYQNGNLEQSEKLYRQVLQQEPDQADALHVLGVILGQAKQFEEATRYIKRLVQLRPDFAEGWRNLGGVLQEQGELEQAIAAYGRAIALNPNDADAKQNLTTALLELDQPFAAVEHADRVVRLKPESADAHYNLGYALRRANRLKEAIASYRRAITLQPNMVLAHKNLGHALLLTGDFLSGFQEIEWRWQQPGWTPRSLGQPEWDGSDLGGKTILLYAEQGIGDTLQFIRYVPLVKARGGRTIVECQPTLLRLLAHVEGIDRVVAQDIPLPTFDVHAPLMSLPRIFKTTPATVPPPISLQLSTLHSPLPTPHSPFKVGIVWAGNPTHRNDRFRSCRLDQFRPLLELADVQFFSLQKGDAEAELQAHPDLPIQNLSDRLSDFVDTASAIAQLNLVITVDTAVAHLAGTLGKPTWLLLMFAADWRWIADRDDTPWYPTMRLFRQTSPGDWAGVFERVREELVEWHEARGARRETGEDMGTRRHGDTEMDVLSPLLPVTPSPRHPSLSVTPSPRRPLSASSHSPLPTPHSLSLAGQLDDLTDWGILGTQLALYLLPDRQIKLSLLGSIVHTTLNPVQRSLLQAKTREAAEGTVVQVLGDRLQPMNRRFDQQDAIGLMALEDTYLDEEAIARAQAYRAIVTGSRWSAEVLRGYGLNPIKVSLQGIDPSLFYPGAKTGLLGDCFVVFCGGGSHVKGQDLAIAAFRAFHSRHPDALLLMAGETEDSELPTDEVLPIGAIAYPLLGQVLREADVALFPSRCEAGINQTIVASLACGIPTILSNNTANRDLLQHNLGFPLHSQRSIGGTSKFRGVAGWGESDLEEIVETLEYVYTQRQEARNRAIAAADFLRDWTWKAQIRQLLAAILR